MADSEIGPVVGVILAGGRAERMGGGDKCLREVGGEQVETLVLNANGDPARFASYGLPVVPDSVPDFAGQSPAGALRRDGAE